MKKLLVLFVLLIPFLFLNNVQAQQWSAEQKEVWKVVETYWALNATANVTEFMNYVDDSYLGWNIESDAPHTKAEAQDWFKYWVTKGKSVLYRITPARIWVNGNFAFVHYYFLMVYETADGTPLIEDGRYTDILMKKENKWVQVGDHGGKTSK